MVHLQYVTNHYQGWFLYIKISIPRFGRAVRSFYPNLPMIYLSIYIYIYIYCIYVYIYIHCIYVYIYICTYYGGFHNWLYPTMDDLSWKIPFKWIFGNPRRSLIVKPRCQHAKQDFGDARQAIINLCAADGGWAPASEYVFIYIYIYTCNIYIYIYECDVRCIYIYIHM